MTTGSGLYTLETRPNDCVVCGGIVQQPVDLMGALAAAPDLLSEAIEERPSGTGSGWSPLEVVVHLADLEVHRGWRFRRTLYEDEPLVDTLDQDALAAALWYPDRDMVTALEVFWVNRRANLELLRMAGEQRLERAYRHPAYGRMTLRSLVEHTTHHDREHLLQVSGR
jgi:DinB superfamily